MNDIDVIKEAERAATEVRHKARDTAQEVILKAENTARTLRELSDNPTNLELKNALDDQAEMLELLSKKLDPILDVYKAVLLSKGFVTGLAGLVIAITAIGVGFSWLINTVVHK